MRVGRVDVAADARDLVPEPVEQLELVVLLDGVTQAEENTLSHRTYASASSANRTRHALLRGSASSGSPPPSLRGSSLARGSKHALAASRGQRWARRTPAQADPRFLRCLVS